jgi:hypothetical protein
VQKIDSVSIEKIYNRWLAALDKPLGGPFGYALFLILIYFSGLRGIEIIGPLALTVALAGIWRLQALAIVNFILFFFFNVTFWTRWSRGKQSYLLIDNLSELATSHVLFIKGISLLCMLSLFFLLARLHMRTQRRYVLHANLGLFFFLTLVFTAFYGAIGPGSTREIFRSILILFSRYFWMITFTHVALPPEGLRRSSFWTNSLNCFPFWSGFFTWYVGAFPRGVGELKNSICLSEVQARESRINGLKLLLLSAGLAKAQFLIHNWIGPYPSPVSMNLGEFNALKLATPLIWVVDIVDGSLIMFSHVSALLLVVGVIRFCGFRIPPAIYAVFRARNFADFIRRIYFYYSETIGYFFLPLIFQKVAKVPCSRRLQNALATFLNLLLGGVCLHFILNVQFSLTNPPDLWTIFARYLPYLFVLALAAGISVYFHIPIKPRTDCELVRPLPIFSFILFAEFS